MDKRFFSVAIDGPAGAGKSTMARRAAAALGFVYVDTGAIYRTIAYAVFASGTDPRDAAAVEALLPGLDIGLRWDEAGMQHMHLAGRDVSEAIRRPEISEYASYISAMPPVRQFLLETQRQTARSHHVIMDGRDIGTVVLPRADVKIFLSASAEVRARRRWLELQKAGRSDRYEDVLREMNDRDWRDSHRAIAPLKAAEDALVLDTSTLDLEQSVEAILKIIRENTGL